MGPTTRVLWKLRISLLWLALAVMTTLHMILAFTQPGVIDELRAGTMEGMDPTGPAAIMWVGFVVVPLLIAFLTMVLPQRLNRWANGVLGLVCAGLWALDFSGDMTAGAFFLTASVIVASLLVVGHAWRWPAERPAAKQREPELV